VPVERQDVDPFSVFRPDASQQREDHHYGESQKTYHDVKSVQADQRVISCSEQIRADRESFFVDQPVPFGASPLQKSGTQRNGREPQDSET